jgi:hypothetical protein
MRRKLKQTPEVARLSVPKGLWVVEGIVDGVMFGIVRGIVRMEQRWG